MLRWRRLVDRLPVGVVAAISPEERISYVNDRAVALFGRHRSDLLGTPLPSYLAPVSWDGHPPLDDDAPGKHRAVLIRLPDGSTTGALATVFRSGVPPGDASTVAKGGTASPCAVHVFQDNTTTDHLRRRLQTILAHSPVSLALLDRTGRVVLGGGGDIQAAVDGIARAAVSSVFDAFPSEREGLDLFRYALCGHSIARTTGAFGGYYDLALSPVLDVHGQVSQVVAVGIDVTARERARTRQADVAQVAHKALKTSDPAVLWSLAADTLARGLRATVSVWEMADRAQLAHAPSGPALGPSIEQNQQLVARLADEVPAPGAGTTRSRPVIGDGWLTMVVGVGRSPQPDQAILVQRPATTGTATFSEDDEQHVRAVADVLGSAVARLVAERRLLHRSLHDGLTGLVNRAAILEHLGLVVAQDGQGGRRTGVVFLDLDGFKTINDTYGHTIGDAVLREVADRLRATVRSRDIVARLGGDEFAVVCPDVQDDVEVERVADRVIARLAEPIAVAGTSFVVTASAGIAISGADLTDPDRLLNASDIAMYAAKRAGGGRCVAHERFMRTDGSGDRPP